MATIITVGSHDGPCKEINKHIKLLGQSVQEVEILEKAYAYHMHSPCALVIISEEALDIQEGWLAPFAFGNKKAKIMVVSHNHNATLEKLLTTYGVTNYASKENVLEHIEVALHSITHEQAAPVKKDSPEKYAIIGKSLRLLQSFEQVRQYARFEGSVLLFGGTGTGKELFARALHAMSPRCNGPLVTVDCASLPPTLVESLLFGHQRGAFTGANTSKTGLIANAHKGTLFLDEVGEMPLEVQKKFLRVLQEHRFLPVGGGKEIFSDFRVVAATNRNLGEMVAAKTFREDLYYRLRVLQVELPPLHLREDDVLHIARYFLQHFCERANIALKILSEDAQQALRAYHWPGNVRELVNAIETAFACAWNQPVLSMKHLPLYVQAWSDSTFLPPARRRDEVDNSSRQNIVIERRKNRGDEAHGQGSQIVRHIRADIASLPTNYREARRYVLEQFDKEYLTLLRGSSQGNISKACSIAQLSRPRLYELYRKYTNANLK